MKRTTILVASVVALAVTVAHAQYDGHFRFAKAARETREIAVDPAGFAGQSIADVFAPRAP